MTSIPFSSPLLDKLPSLRPGDVWLVGAGPGDIGHLTLLALSAMVQADVIIHDALVSSDILALASPSAIRIDAGKRGGKPSVAQSDITQQLILLARSGRRVVRLKGGDPYIFGRGGEEAMALAKAGIAFRVVPGLTSGLAGLAGAGFPPTMRQCNQALILATGHGAERDDGLEWAAIARTGQPIVLYMAMTNLDTITARLLAGGLSPDTPAAIVMAASTAEERVLITMLATLAADARDQGFGSPAIVAIGRNIGVGADLRRLVAATGGAA